MVSSTKWHLLNNLQNTTIINLCSTLIVIWLITRVTWCRLSLKWCFIVLNKLMSTKNISTSLLRGKAISVLTVTLNVKRDLSLHKLSKELWASPISWLVRWKRSSKIKMKVILTWELYLIFKQFIQATMNIIIAININSLHSFTHKLLEELGLLQFVEATRLRQLSYLRIYLLKLNKIIKTLISNNLRTSQAVVATEVQGRAILTALVENHLIWVSIEKSLDELCDKKAPIVNSQNFPRRMLMINQ